MKTLVTSTGRFLTGDEICDAVIDYWESLVADHASAVIEIPFLTEANERSFVRLSIGWGIPIAAVDSSSRTTLSDPALVQSLALRAHPRTSYASTPFDADEMEEESAWADA